MLFQLLNNLLVDKQQRFWIANPEANEDTCDIREDLGQIATEVKIALPVSNNTLTSVEGTYNDLRIDAVRRPKTTPLTGAQPPHNPQLD